MYMYMGKVFLSCSLRYSSKNIKIKFFTFFDCHDTKFYQSFDP